MKVRVCQLKGHRDEVLCVESPLEAQKHCMLSGSADGTARLWDIRNNSPTSVNCFFSPGKTPVNAVQFGGNGTIGENRVLLATENNVYCFDLRKPGVTGKILLGENDHICSFPPAQDEINQISVSPKGLYVATADDAGFVRIFSLQQFEELLNFPDTTISMKPVSLLSHSNQQNIICTTVKFTSERQVITGGMDCTVAKWNTSKKKEFFKLNFSESGQQMMNPKYIYSIDALDNLAAIATGSGDVYVTDHTSGELLYSLNDIHASAVSQVRLVRRPENLLITTGNDSKITIWKLPTEVKKQTPKANPSAKKQRKAKKHTKRQKSVAATPKSQETVISSELTEPKKVATISHHSKANWIAVHDQFMSRTDSLSFFVADQTNDISFYSLNP